MQQTPPTGTALKLTWAAQILAAAILAQTLFFKFTGAPEAVEISRPWGSSPSGASASASSSWAPRSCCWSPARRPWEAW